MDLGRGVTLYLPSWRAMTLDRSFIEGVGIAPDEPAAFVRGAPSDAVLDRAVELLTEPE